jgi:hypothetical protein
MTEPIKVRGAGVTIVLNLLVRVVTKRKCCKIAALPRDKPTFGKQLTLLFGLHFLEDICNRCPPNPQAGQAQPCPHEID